MFTEAELHSRLEIKLENYTKVLNIEGETALMMAEREILPASLSYMRAMARTVNEVKSAGAASPAAQKLLAQLTELTDKLYDTTEALRSAIATRPEGDAYQNAVYEHDVIIPAMGAVRTVADSLETIVGKEYWPFPTYADLLFNV